MTQPNDTIYQELINRILEAEKDLYGELAIGYARRVRGIEISEEGKVLRWSESPGSVIRELLRVYEELGGRLAKHVAKSVVAAYQKSYPTLGLFDEYQI